MNNQTIQVKQREFEPECTGYDTNNPLCPGDKVTFTLSNSTGPRDIAVKDLSGAPSSDLFGVSSFTVNSSSVEMTVQTNADGEYVISTEQQGTNSGPAPMTGNIKVVKNS